MIISVMQRRAAIAFAIGLVLSANAQTATQHSLGEQLVEAVRTGDLEKSRALLGEWKSTGKPWPLGLDDKPLLFLAIEGREANHPQIVELLIENGGDVNARGPAGMTALHWAASHGYPERTAQILTHKPQLEATDDNGRTSLLVAHSEAASQLIAAGGNVLALDKDGLGALHFAAAVGARHLQFVFEGGCKNVNARSKAGLTPLHIAAIEGADSAASWLIEHGADVNASTTADYNYLPRGFATGYGYEVRIARGSTPLRIAAAQHEGTKWSSGRYRAILDVLKRSGAKK